MRLGNIIRHPIRSRWQRVNRKKGEFVGKELAPQTSLEPTTLRLTAECSTSSSSPTSRFPSNFERGNIGPSADFRHRRFPAEFTCFQREIGRASCRERG